MPKEQTLMHCKSLLDTLIERDRLKITSQQHSIDIVAMVGALLMRDFIEHELTQLKEHKNA